MAQNRRHPQRSWSSFSVAVPCLSVVFAAACVPQQQQVGSEPPIGGGEIVDMASPSSSTTGPQFGNPLNPVTASAPPTPISGGTLTVTSDGRYAVAADSERDRVAIVDLTNTGDINSAAPTPSIVTLLPGDEPGRVVIDNGGLAHVALRRGGAVVSINIANHSIVARRAVCAAPRGLAFDGTASALYVACAGGELVTLPAAGGPATRKVMLDDDLRDVVVSGTRLLVTRFRSAEILVVNADGTVDRDESARMHPATFNSVSARPNTSFTPAVAWRAVPTGDGGALVLHQRGQVQPIELAATSPTTGFGSGGSDVVDLGFATPLPPPVADAGFFGDVDAFFGDNVDSGFGGGGSTGYGGGGGGGGTDPFACSSSIVHSTITTVAPGTAQAPSLPAPLADRLFTNVTLAVDLAVSSDGVRFALAVPGNAVLSGAQDVVIIDKSTKAFVSGNGECVVTDPGLNGMNPSNARVGQAVAVAFVPSGVAQEDVLVQTREPAMLVRLTPTGSVTIALGGDSRQDTGHTVFHSSSGNGIACASCHPEGGEDGRTWNFHSPDHPIETGARRTQSLRGGVTGMTPLHWEGDMDDFHTLETEVFEGRMGGPSLSTQQVGALSHWLDTVPYLPIAAPADTAAVARGAVLYNDLNGPACAACHSGTKLTTRALVDVGTGGTFKVPSLRGIQFRAPFLHDGRSATLADRFGKDATEAHGNTFPMTTDQVNDLIAYLNTL